MPEQLDYQQTSARRRSMRWLAIRLMFVGAITLLLVWAWLFMRQIEIVVQTRRELSKTSTYSYPFKNAQAISVEGSSYVYSQTGLKIFEHLSRSVSNRQRIVSITASVDYIGDVPRVSFHAMTSTLPTIWPGSHREILQSSGLNVDSDKVFAGQPDPKDESHFTIDYQRNGKTDVIDGWLMADDTVKLEPRGHFQ